jgi:hypothetical protein
MSSGYDNGTGMDDETKNGFEPFIDKIPGAWFGNVASSGLLSS